MVTPAKPRALLIDDDELVRAMLTDVLQTFGYIVSAAATGEAALIDFAPGRYDVVVTDHRMPGMTGLEVALVVRDIDPSVPVILLTGGGATEELAAASRDMEVVYKPVNVVKLVAKLDAVRGRAASA